MKNQILMVKGSAISFFSREEEDYISLTDIARHKNPEEPKDLVKNWMRSKTTIEFLGLWEQLHNPAFKGVEFDSFMYQAGSNSFILSPSKWIDATGAVGIVSRPGNAGGTFAHRDIAFEFAAWVSPGFKLFLLKEFQRLKKEENERLKTGWSFQRTLAKVNYRIHTDAIKDSLVPPELTGAQVAALYATEADILNMALFGKTAKQWRRDNPGRAGNIRDHAALEQLVVLSNLESINSVLIRQGMPQGKRLRQLNEIAITQMRSLAGNKTLKKTG
ncbi:MAG: KilA/APSES-type HTH DNA-binding domain-containing protein [Elusimicrobia bacterium]|nr:MAG: KilA/APSES-type HTH DNA-binding domain-containing protein [Elusimicrobiota bacterium]KAF0157107.1 MAG: KilA/APSES-type HTH DNA-binding domain-containing protein [Elusimicrobiota bacterium]